MGGIKKRHSRSNHGFEFRAAMIGMLLTLREECNRPLLERVGASRLHAWGVDGCSTLFRTHQVCQPHTWYKMTVLID